MINQCHFIILSKRVQVDISNIPGENAANQDSVNQTAENQKRIKAIKRELRKLEKEYVAALKPYFDTLNLLEKQKNETDKLIEKIDAKISGINAKFDVKKQPLEDELNTFGEFLFDWGKIP